MEEHVIQGNWNQRFQDVVICILLKINYFLISFKAELLFYVNTRQRRNLNNTK